MTGNFKITHAYLKSLNPCQSGWDAFHKSFPPEDHPDGVEYQRVLDKAAENNHIGYARWLLKEIGPTEDTLVLDSIDAPDEVIVFAGNVVVEEDINCDTIIAGRDIKTDGSIKANWCVEAGGHIKTGGSIKAVEYIEAGRDIETGDSVETGWYIKAGGHIKAGRWISTGGYIVANGHIKTSYDYGIYAGSRLNNPHIYTISASEKPENIVSGVFVQKEDGQYIDGYCIRRRRHNPEEDSHG